MAPVPALPSHQLLMVLVQMAAILVVSHLLGELSKRLEQPAVIGELLSGIALGPSLLGWVWPRGFQMLFPQEPSQMHLLELLAWLGMVLLLLFTGLETDVRRLRHLGRAALLASVLGIVIPFAAGWAFADALPDRLLAGSPLALSQRPLFDAFFATAMAISAIPVIAKILFDLEIIQRDLGLVILSAGVVDDTVGWIVLSVIAGLVGTGFSAPALARTLALTAGFLVVTIALVYPVARWLFRLVDDRFHSRHADLALIVVLAFLAAAATEAIGIHAVFGAFVAGCLMRQVPRIRAASLRRLEAVVFAIFAPLFFGLVGIKVDLRALGDPWALLAALAVATSGKVVGCTLGGLLGRLSFWESLSIGVGMNARGAMGLVVALIGLQLGILSPGVYSMLVVVAVVTSFMAPIGLRLTMRRVAISDEERARLAALEKPGLFDPRALRALLLTAGGPNALAAARLLAGLARGHDATVTALYLERGRPSLIDRLRGALRRDRAGTQLAEHLEAVRALLEPAGSRLESHRVLAPGGADLGALVRREAARGADLVLAGAGPNAGQPFRGELLSALLADLPSHFVLVRAGEPPPDGAPGRVLARFDDSYASRAAVELALHYAEGAGCELTVLYALDPNAVLVDEDGGDGALDEAARRMIATTMMATATPLLARTTARVKVLVREADALRLPLLAEAASERYAMIVVGAERRAVQNRISAGYELSRLAEVTRAAVVVVVPRIGE